jgi:N-acetylneuraminic acid mutarotase
MKLGSTALPDAPWPWRERAPMPRPRAGLIQGAVGSLMVVAGGSYWEDDRKFRSDRTDLFDPVSNRWTSGPALPSARSDAACAVLADTLYVFGGGADGEPTDDLLALRDGTWSVLPLKLPEPRINAFAVALAGRIYVVGGVSRTGDQPSIASTVWSWDPASTDGFRVHAAIPGRARISFGIAAHGGRIHLFGGFGSSGADDDNLDEVIALDPAADRWSSLPPLPVARRAWWAHALGEGILLLGGYTDGFSSEIYVFDPATATATLGGTLPHGLADSKFVQIGNQLLTAGGESGNRIRAPWTYEIEIGD